MSRTIAVSFVFIGLVAFLFGGCQRKAIIEGEKSPGVITREAPTPEEAQAAEEREQIEASLQTKRYPGIEGEVFESSLIEDIYFAFDRYDLSAKSRQILSRNAEIFLKFPEAQIQIEGHCDERGTNEYNLALGDRRAMTAKNYLMSLGVPQERLSRISYGEEMPIDSRHNEEAWSKNRRAHFVILSR